MWSWVKKIENLYEKLQLISTSLHKLDCSLCFLFSEIICLSHWLFELRFIRFLLIWTTYTEFIQMVTMLEIFLTSTVLFWATDKKLAEVTVGLSRREKAHLTPYRVLDCDWHVSFRKFRDLHLFRPWQQLWVNQPFGFFLVFI